MIGSFVSLLCRLKVLPSKSLLVSTAVLYFKCQFVDSEMTLDIGVAEWNYMM